MKSIANFFAQILYNCTRELQIIIKDPGAVLILLLALLIYPIVYSFAYKNEVLKESDIAIVDLDNTATSRMYARMAGATEQLNIAYKTPSLVEARELFYQRKVKGIILIPADFEKNLLHSKQSQVIAYTDAGYILVYKQIYSGAMYAARTLGGGVEVKRLIAEGNNFSQAVTKQSPLQVKLFQLFNPSGGYGSFVMPAMILIIMQQTLLIGIGLVGGTFKEQNAYKSYNIIAHKRGNALCIVTGKALAYLAISLTNSFIALLFIYDWFGFPDKSGFLKSFIVLIPFFLSTIFLGLAISLQFKSRINSLLFTVFLSPIVLFLSGVSWPIQAIPSFLYNLSHIFPSCFAVPAYLKLRIQGSSVDSYNAEWTYLLIQMGIYFLLALLSYSNGLHQFKKMLSKKTRLTTS